MSAELQQGSPEWLDLRKKYIGASDAPVIMKVSPWKTPYQLWQEKLDLIPSQEASPSMLYGQMTEEKARQVYQEMKGQVYEPRVFFSKKHGFMMASLDGYCECNNSAVEIKCANNEDHENALAGIIPTKYYPQLQHQMEVLDIEEMDYFSYHCDHGVIVKVKRDKAYIEELLSKEKDFWDNVLNFKEPEFTEKDYLVYEDEESFDLSSRYAKIMDQVDAKKTEIKFLESQKKDLENLIQNKAKDHNAIVGALKATRYSRKGNIDYKSAPPLLQKQLEEYRKPSTICWKFSLL